MERKPPRILVPPVYMVLGLMAMTALHLFVPLARTVPVPWSYAGAVLIVLGIAITATAAGAFAHAGTPIRPFEPSTALVTTGVYRYTRNPMYLGLVLILLGAAVMFGTLSAFLPIPIFVWIIQTRFILGEEQFLEKLFGQQYLDYKRRVRRWL